jgi:hypothetical protein
VRHLATWPLLDDHTAGAGISPRGGDHCELLLQGLRRMLVRLARLARLVRPVRLVWLVRLV